MSINCNQTNSHQGILRDDDGTPLVRDCVRLEEYDAGEAATETTVEKLSDVFRQGQRDETFNLLNKKCAVNAAAIVKNTNPPVPKQPMLQVADHVVAKPDAEAKRRKKAPKKAAPKKTTAKKAAPKKAAPKKSGPKRGSAKPNLQVK